MYELLESLKQKILWDAELDLSGYPFTETLDTLPDFNPAIQKIKELKTDNEPLKPADPYQLLKDKIISCTGCPLYKNAPPLFATGPSGAKIAFAGDMPRLAEQQSGIPFSGDRGILLDKILSAMSLSRNTVYLCNIVKCHGAFLRGAPLQSVKTSAPCSNLFKEQLSLVKPEIIVAMGQTTAQFILNTDKSIDELRGRFFTWNNIKVMPTYHLDYILKKPAAKRPLWDDLKKVMSGLK